MTLKSNSLTRSYEELILANRPDLLNLPYNQQVEIVESFLDEETTEELAAFNFSWEEWARPEQLPPEQWGKDGCFIWNIRAGRGWGKTKTGAETFIKAVTPIDQGGWGYQHPNLVGATAEDVRDLMIEGESGILASASPDFYPEYVPSSKRLNWPNGVITHIYYGSEPEKGRGPQSDILWCDELAKWQFAEKTFDNLMFGLRLGPKPLCVITSTPKPSKFLQELEKRKDEQGRNITVVTRGHTDDNMENLSPVFIATVISKYRGTRLGRQELAGEFLDDNPDALWKRQDIEDNRVFQIPPLIKVVTGIDPAVTSKDGSDDTGIIVAGKDQAGHGYILGDYTCHVTPRQWAEAALAAHNKHGGNWIVGEVNNGGDLVETNIRSVDPRAPYKAVHASRGKQTRAEPISSLYEQGMIHHFGTFPELEDEMCEWIPGAEKSPDRIDAAVWALTMLDIKHPVGNAPKTPLPVEAEGRETVNANRRRRAEADLFGGGSMPQW